MAGRSPIRYFLYSVTALTAVSLGICIWLASGPDHEILFEREVPSELSPRELDRWIGNAQSWPQWHFSTAKIALTGPEEKGAEIVTGSRVRLFIDPRKGRWKKFELLMSVEEYVPGRFIRMKLLEDTKQRLTSLFDDIEYRIDLLPRQSGTTLRGTVTARTKHWRSRLFSRLTQRVMMNQVFYPDLMRLARGTAPDAADWYNAVSQNRPLPNVAAPVTTGAGAPAQPRSKPQ